MIDCETISLSLEEKRGMEENLHFNEVKKTRTN